MFFLPSQLAPPPLLPHHLLPLLNKPHYLSLKAMHQKLYQGLKAQAKINTGGHRDLGKISREEMSKP
jgi:hypothetical protein